jgi:hypothetical protein
MITRENVFWRMINNLLKFFLRVVMLCILPIQVMAVDALPRVYLLPQPQRVEWHLEVYELASVRLNQAQEFPYLNKWVQDVGLEISQDANMALTIIHVDDIDQAEVNKDEAYRLIVGESEITIHAITGKGVFNALQTLRQLLFMEGNQQMVQSCSITDWPAFPIRGFMHDVGRGFIPFEELKDQIRLLSKFKINVFHWHLTEDIAWRLESKVFPQLTATDNFLRLPGKYYTIEQARELIEFCKEHNVLLIPEIDMPGHSMAFTRAMGHDMQSEEGMRLLKIVMDEICKVFHDVPYIHIGTDEVKFTNPDFVPVMVNFLRERGKKVISWNPGWHYNEGEIDMVHLWSFRGRLHDGIPAIDSRYHYTNHFDAFSDIVGLFHSNTGRVQQSNEQVAGAIIALWNDRHVDSTEEILNQNIFYPSMLTLAERTWVGGGEHYVEERGVNIHPDNEQEIELFKEFENRMLHFKDTWFDGMPFPYVRQTNVKWHITDPFPNHGDLSQVFPPEEELQKKYIYNGVEYGTHKAIGAGIYLRHVWGNLVPAFFEEPRPNHTAYAYTWVWSPEAQEAGLFAGFQNYSRSESDLPPPQGQWDYNQSRIWLNDKEIMPPVWENTHATRTNEISLRNENWEARPPIPVSLEKGWNKVFIKLPVGAFSRPEVRLVKWMFTAVFVTPDGKNALDNIVYSPDKTL